MKFQTTLQTSGRLGEVIIATDAAVGCIKALRLFSESGLYQIHLVLAEFVANAIEHGNKFDSTKSVFVLMQTIGNDVGISVVDEGPGVTEAMLEKPYDPSLLRGRGLHIVRGITGNLGIKGSHIYTVLTAERFK